MNSMLGGGQNGFVDELGPAKERLIAKMKAELGIGPELVQAFRAVPREAFAPESCRNLAYEDVPLQLAPGSTISQPSMVALTLRELRLVPGLSLLEVGSGSGYLLALAASLGANVCGVEINAEIAARSRTALSGLGISASVIIGNAVTVVLPQLYDRICFSAAVEKIPRWAVDALTATGFVLAPVGDSSRQELIRADAWGKESRTGLLCRYVPFVNL